MISLNIFKHLLPRAKAWSLTENKTIRHLFTGLTAVAQQSKIFIDNIYSDIDPQKTRQLDIWDNQFNLAKTGISVQGRRDRLDATWKALGGQSKEYIQNTLQTAGFDVYVHEYWADIADRPNGGSVNKDVSPTVLNPSHYLSDGTEAGTYLMFDGGDDAQGGDAIAMDGAVTTPTGYPLVNKVTVASSTGQGDGGVDFQDNDVIAQDGGFSLTYALKKYKIPTDPTVWPYFLYFTGAIFPKPALVPVSRRAEFEDLCLKICPLEQWLGLVIEYGALDPSES